jgi:hypothetical protein
MIADKEAKAKAEAAKTTPATTTTETKKEETKKSETKPAANTEPPAGPGACGKAEACDTEVAGVKVYCGA